MGCEAGALAEGITTRSVGCVGHTGKRAYNYKVRYLQTAMLTIMNHVV